MASNSNSATSLSASATAASAPSPGVQVHPVAIEAAVPLGKKVRLGEGKAAAGKRKKKEKRARSKSKSPTKSRTATAAEQQEATRAERLAANLGELLVDLPTTTTSGEAAPADATAAVDLSEVRRRSSRQESPTTKSPDKSRSRHHKSLSPDKTKAAIR